MTPTKQEFTHKPEIGQHGDCQRAVLASLLDLPISEVPHFLQNAGGDPGIFWDSIQTFLHKHGYAWLVVPATERAAWATWLVRHHPQKPYRLPGKQRRAMNAAHAAINSQENK